MSSFSVNILIIIVYLCIRTYEEDTEEAMKQCQVLLGEPNVDTAVRIGDVCGLMIEHYARKQKWQAVSQHVFTRLIHDISLQ